MAAGIKFRGHDRFITNMILSGKQPELLIPEGRLIMPADPVIDERHKAYMLDDDEQDVPTTKEWTE